MKNDPQTLFALPFLPAAQMPPSPRFIFLVFMLLLNAGAPLPAAAADGGEARRIVWQPVQRYFIRRQGGDLPSEGRRRLNSFNAYTHLGTDFGFHGPAEHEIEWVSDEIKVHLGQQPDTWAGMWHSLAGQARHAQQVLDFARPFPAMIADVCQPRISQLMLEAGGRGSIKIEIKDAAGAILWEKITPFTDEKVVTISYPLPVEQLRQAKMLVWTAEPGSEVTVRGLHLGVEVQSMPRDLYTFSASYAKLLRCHNLRSGFTRDRAHLDEGAFESLAATGLMVLATAAAADPELAVVTPQFARDVIGSTHEAVLRLKRARGLLPHFVWKLGSEYLIHPNTEYSTVDTALYTQCALLAQRLLGMEKEAAETLALIRGIDVDALRLPSGHLSHGLDQDGTRLLPHGWRDWGGEAALVLLTQRMARPGCAVSLSDRPGHAWQGTGFITEIQSLLHPDFDREGADALDGVHWKPVRQVMLGAQQAYFPKSMPQSLAARLGIHGLSAGENQNGNAYHVGGIDLSGQALIHPHYILMSAALEPEPARVLALLERLEKAGYFPPWGLVENLTADGSSYLPMNGALNAGFEALGAYHLLAKNRRIPDTIHDASRQCPEIRQAMTLFYPASTSTTSGAQ